MSFFLTPVPAFLALVLIASAAHKIVVRERLASAFAQLCGTSNRLGRFLCLAAASIEAGSAIAIVVPASRPGGALAAAALWTFYAALLGVRTIDREAPFDWGREFDKPRREPRDRASIARALVLAALAMMTMLLPTGGLALESLSAALGYFVVYLAAGEIAVLPPLHRTLVI
jgi:hypothetical protein